MFWSETFLEDLRQYTVNRIAVFQYCVNGQWSDAEILNKTVIDKNILLTVSISSAESFVISGVRINDENGITIGQIQENITKKSDALTVDWVFPLYEI